MLLTAKVPAGNLADVIKVEHIERPSRDIKSHGGVRESSEEQMTKSLEEKYKELEEKYSKLRDHLNSTR